MSSQVRYMQMHCLYSMTTTPSQAHLLDVSKLRAKTDSRRENVCLFVYVHVCAFIAFLSVFPLLVATLLHFSVMAVDKTCKSKST